MAGMDVGLRDAIVLWMAAASLVGFFLAAYDKNAAMRGRRRVPENSFHATAALGGWPGAIVGFLLLRHKTRKPRFLVVFALFLLLNVAALIGLWIWQH